MEVYIIANIRDHKNRLLGYRLLNIEQMIEIKDVTKPQLLYAMKHKKIKIENAKASGTKITGIYHSLDSLCNRVVQGDDIKNSQAITSDANKIVILKQLVREGVTIGYTAADREGNVKNIKVSDLSNIVYLYNIINHEVVDGKSVVKAKKEELELTRKSDNKKADDRITDEEARNPDVVWDINRFMKYMEQNNYSYLLRDDYGNDIKENSATFVAEKYTQYGELKIYVCEIDEKCKIIHLPYGIYSVERFYNSFKYNENIEIDTIIISSTVMQINHLDNKIDQNRFLFCKKNNIDVTNLVNCSSVYYRYINCKRLFFQPDMTSDVAVARRYTGLSNMNITEELNIFELANYGRITGRLDEFIVTDLLNNSTLPYIPKPKISEVSMEECFCGIDIKGNNNVDLTGYCKIKRCFDGVDVIDNLKIGNTLDCMIQSFRCLHLYDDKYLGKYLPNIDFRGSNIRVIQRSFSGHISPVTCIDISWAKKLIRIDNSFTDVENITEIILPKRLEVLKNRSFESAENVKELILPDSIDICTLKIGKGKTKVVFPKDFSKSISLDRNIDGLPEILSMPDNFTIIAEDGLIRARCSEITNTENIVSIGKRAFMSSYLEEIDFRNFPKVGLIPDRCFHMSEVSTVIISSNIHTISEEAFSHCSKLRKAFISKDVKEIQTRAFYKCAASNGGVVTIYTVRNSEAHKYFKTKKNFSLLLFDNDEDALKDMNIVTASDGQKDKFKFLSASLNDYEELKEEPYLSNCGELMKLHRLSESECSPYEGNIDESMFDFEGPYIDSFINLKLEYIKFSPAEEGYMWDGKYTKQFAGYCALLSRLANNNMDIFKNDKAINTLKACAFKGKSLMYNDLHCRIMVIQILTTTNHKINMVIITIDKKIVWCAPFDHNKLISSLVSNYTSFLGDNRLSVGQKKNNADITSKLKVGDWCTELGMFDINSTNLIDIANSTNDRGCVIGGMQCPISSDKYTGIFEEIFEDDLRMIEFHSVKDLIKNRLEPEKGVFKSSSTYTALMYSLTNQKVYTVKIKCGAIANVDGSFLANTIIKDIEQVNIVAIEDLDTAMKCKSKYLKMNNIIEAFRDEYTHNLLRLYSLDEQKIKSLYNAKDAFYRADYKDDNKAYAVGKVLKEKNIDNVEMLGGKQLKYILKSGLCVEMDETLGDIINKFEDKLTIKTLKDSEILFSFNIEGPEIKRKQNIVYIYAVAKISDEYKDIKVYESHLDLQTLLNTLKSLTNKLNGKELHGITNEDIDTRDFQWIASDGYGNSYNRVRFDIAIQNETCEWFLTANTDDISYITLFRFKSLKDAEKFLFEYDNESMTHKELSYSLFLLLYHILQNRAEDFNNDDKPPKLWDIRESIMQGLPENWSTYMISNDLFKILPKQPGKKSLKYKS